MNQVRLTARVFSAVPEPLEAEGEFQARIVVDLPGGAAGDRATLILGGGIPAGVAPGAEVRVEGRLDLEGPDLVVRASSVAPVVAAARVAAPARIPGRPQGRVVSSSQAAEVARPQEQKPRPVAAGSGSGALGALSGLGREAAFRRPQQASQAQTPQAVRPESSEPVSPASAAPRPIGRAYGNLGNLTRSTIDHDDRVDIGAPALPASAVRSARTAQRPMAEVATEDDFIPFVE